MGLRFPADDILRRLILWIEDDDTSKTPHRIANSFRENEIRLNGYRFDAEMLGSLTFEARIVTTPKTLTFKF